MLTSHGYNNNFRPLEWMDFASVDFVCDASSRYVDNAGLTCVWQDVRNITRSDILNFTPSPPLSQHGHRFTRHEYNLDAVRHYTHLELDITIQIHNAFLAR